MILKLQKVRAGTKYESYRISIPKLIIKHYKLENSFFKLEIKGGKLILTPIKKKKKIN
ncbi:hypothetical protein ES703_56213 [subsurface metagenome]